MEGLMNEDVRRKHFEESHERAVRQAMFDATDDLIRRRKEKGIEKQSSFETRLVQNEKQLENLELVRK